MRIALLTDFHADPELLAMLVEKARRHHVKAIWNFGPVLAGCLFPNEVLDILRREKVLSLLTESDLQVLRSCQSSVKLRHFKQPDQWLYWHWLVDSLTIENRRYLRSIPRSQRQRLCKKLVLTGNRLSDLEIPSQTDLIVGNFGQSPLPRQRERQQLVDLAVAKATPDSVVYGILDLGSTPCPVQYFRVKLNNRSWQQRAAAAFRQLPAIFWPYIPTPGDRQVGPSLLQALKTFNPPATEAVSNDAPLVQDRVYALLDNFLQKRPQLILHSHCVTQLALQLFDQLQPLHRLEGPARRWLQYAGLLHDIGWVTGSQSHHKTSLHIILHTAFLPLEWEERAIIGLTARYHRRTEPNKRHDFFDSLRPERQQLVTVLASLLRIADCLDASQQQVVQGLTCRLDPTETVRLQCDATAPLQNEQEKLDQKGILFEKTFKRKLVLEWNVR